MFTQQFWRFFGVELALNLLSLAVLAIVILWVLFAYVRGTPRSRLKRYAITALWTVAPTLLVHGIQYFVPTEQRLLVPYSGHLLGFFNLLSIIGAALFAGCSLRVRHDPCARLSHPDEVLSTISIIAALGYGFVLLVYIETPELDQIDPRLVVIGIVLSVLLLGWFVPDLYSEYQVRRASVLAASSPLVLSQQSTIMALPSGAKMSQRNQFDVQPSDPLHQNYVPPVASPTQPSMTTTVSPSPLVDDDQAAMPLPDAPLTPSVESLSLFIANQLSATDAQPQPDQTSFPTAGHASEFADAPSEPDELAINLQQLEIQVAKPAISVSPAVPSPEQPGPTTDLRPQSELPASIDTAVEPIELASPNQPEILRPSLPVTSQPTPPVPAIPQSRPPSAIAIKLRRAQRTSVMGKVIFTLDARIELPAEERGLVTKYRLGPMVVYDSDTRKEQEEATSRHLEESLQTGSIISGKSAALSWYKLGRVGVSAAIAAFKLRVTIDGLIKGVHVECKDLGEMIAAENAVVAAGQVLRAYLDRAATFDGREEVVEL